LQNKLQLINIWFRFPFSDWIFRNVSLELENGIYIIVGRNGVGKTTLLRIIAGILKPQKGRIYINSKEINSVKDAVKLVSFMPSSPYNMIIGPTVYDDIKKAVKAFNNKLTAREIIEFFSIEHLKEKKVFHLSYGEVHIVALASVYALGTPIILLDEPTVGLDKKYREKLVQLLKKISGDRIVVIAANDLRLIPIGQKIIALNNGGIDFIGDPKVVFYNYLEKIGVGISDIVQFAKKMKIESKPITVKELKSEILRLIGDSNARL